MGNFPPLEVVGRGSETRIQVGENLNDLILIAVLCLTSTSCQDTSIA